MRGSPKSVVIFFVISFSFGKEPQTPKAEALDSITLLKIERQDFHHISVAKHF